MESLKMCFSKVTVDRLKRQLTEWKKHIYSGIFTNHIHDKGFLFEMGFCYVHQAGLELTV